MYFLLSTILITVGNFTRCRSKHWIIGCILGPNDSKTFEETERERQSNVGNGLQNFEKKMSLKYFLCLKDEIIARAHVRLQRDKASNREDRKTDGATVTEARGEVEIIQTFVIIV